MSKSILIIGAGTGLSLGVALKFGKQGYKVGLISRNRSNLENLQQILKDENIESFYNIADIKNEDELAMAINGLLHLLGGIDILFYNAANLKIKNILEESQKELTEDFVVNVGGALKSFQLLHNELESRNGSMLLAGGGLAFHPSAELGSLALGKAGIRNLALQLNEIGIKKGIYVGILNITNRILPESTTHSPNILAEKFWNLNANRTLIEETY